jgi:hypothetical protein
VWGTRLQARSFGRNANAFHIGVCAVAVVVELGDCSFKCDNEDAPARILSQPVFARKLAGR